MDPALEIRVYDNHQLVHTTEFAGAMELGRQSAGEQPPFALVTLADGGSRMVIARMNEDGVSRRHLRIEPLADLRLRLTNLSTAMPVQLADSILQPGGSRDVGLATLITIGGRALRVQSLQRSEPEAVKLQNLPDATCAPGKGMAQRLPSVPDSRMGDLAQLTVVRALRSAMEVMQSAATTSSFFEQAAKALVEIVGLDSGRVLMLSEGIWQPVSVQMSHLASGKEEWRPSRTILKRAVEEKRTFWQVPDAAASESLKSIYMVVVSPILDRDGQVIGVIYGDRQKRSSAGSTITELDALFVELLASGVAAGLARLEQEQAALRSRVQFEQFFTPELSRQLEVEPNLLEGRDLDVTVLFCDIRGFSRISERLGPAGTVDWIRAVMGALSDCVCAQGGVPLDYIGDELLAMWGAPAVQPDHAVRACRAALAMIEQLPQLGNTWAPIIKEPLALGIGINSGVARVGNIGTLRKFKYGCLGNTVNLASRVQGATKYLRVPLLVTGSTQAKLDGSFLCRRLGSVAVVNIAEPVSLHELVLPSFPLWPDLRQGYESALAEFERRDFCKSASILGRLLEKYPGDGPSVLLLSRVAQALVEPREGDDHLVWQLPGK